ncbi:RNA-binding protein [Candidatus Bathyarchaeota archaeon]|jgi:exosome complex component RRP4|nr:RNA-binding protein [Candidatus Bathyarchaeota archaeon]MDP6048229.1 exosome complex RNA-binding protein Rrp4 [Candidatus Bathyarchaeota archaeon]MDP7443187.1 exosome complex RNA-binding protein Rrp4 [Candidatus Bathyarchaeota archaeon]|tara:strand:+ start:3032 stop:3724 length:693 start_codon:yes stop_codon:yes gene_type:complete
MSELFETRDLVIPGDVLFEGRVKTGDNTHRADGKVFASRIGLVTYNRGMVSVIALEAGFNPLTGDQVIGQVKDIRIGRWMVDIDAAEDGALNVIDAIDAQFRTDFDMTRVLDIGDTVVAKIVDIDRRRTPILSILGRDLGRVNEGFIMRFTPSKIPRLIGKKGSMINMIFNQTGSNVVIGQNGRILIHGRTREQEKMAVKVITKVENEAHISGLTSRVKEYLRLLKEENR